MKKVIILLILTICIETALLVTEIRFAENLHTEMQFECMQDNTCGSASSPFS